MGELPLEGTTKLQRCCTLVMVTMLGQMWHSPRHITTDVTTVLSRTAILTYDTSIMLGEIDVQWKADSRVWSGTHICNEIFIA